MTRAAGTWALGIAAASVGVAAIVLLVVGLTLGSSASPCS